MATAGIDGNIRIWDLRDARLLHLIEDAHAAEVHTLHFCYNQPVLVSSGADNCIKQWIFDNPDNSPRILRQRYGHSRTPNKIRFYGEDPFSIISVSPDRSVRIFSTLKLTRGAELSQGNIESSSNRCNTPAQNLKLPPAIHLDSSGQKHNNWDDIVTCHLGESCARTWSFENKTLGPHVLPSLDKSEVICASLSSCGNFATIGSKNGGVYRYNIQSGAHRATYKDCASAHTLAVTGISSDSINKKLITSSSDKTIKFWDFNSRELLKRLKFNDAVVLLSFNRGSNFAVASFSNLVMRVIDIETYNTVRIFSGHRNRIMDICFSPDSRFIATCSLDSTIRLWDVATGHSVDILETPSIPISIAFSPNGDFLASTHLDGNGIFLWSNTIFYKSFSLSTTRDDRLHKSRWILPKSSGTTIKRSSPAHDRNRRITLSNQPHSRCNSLINIEVIMKRNKPIQPKEDPKLPPFFLTLASENVPVKLSEGNVKLKGAPRASRILKFNEVQSDFVKELISAYTTNNYSSFIDYIETLPVVTLASEIQLIGINTNSDIIPAFIIAMTRSIGSSKKNYNTVQAYLHMFIRVSSCIPR